MKRITFLLLLAASFIATNVFAKSDVLIPTYFVNENFTGAVAYPTGWADATTLIGSNNAGVSWTSPASNQLSVAGSGSGTRGRSISYPTSGTETAVYVDFDFFVTSSMIGNRNALGIILHDNAGNNILSLYACGSDAKWHYWNIEKDSSTFVGGSFNRASTSLTITDARNIGSQLNFAYSTGVWFNLKATLNFTTKMAESMVLTKISDASSVTSTNQPFLNAAAADLTKISLVNTRSSNAGNGSNANLNVSIDNFKTYKLIDVATASVTINYKDAGGNLLKTSRIQPDLQVGSTYTAPASDKETFSDASFYYAYDAVASTDNVVVAEGAVINLIFKKTPVTAGIYIWGGSTNSNWNNSDENFTVGSSSYRGYQNNNPILFPAVPITKTVNLNADLTIGDNDITQYGDAYNFSGTGSISGTGKFILGLQSGETVTMGIKNNMTGGVDLKGGTAIITNDLGSASFTVADGGKLTLQSGASFSKAIAGTGTLNIEAASNNYYLMPITGASVVNIQLNNAGSGTSATWSDYFGGSFPGDAQINVTTGLAAAGFGVQGGVLTNNKVNLGNGVRLLHWYNQSTSGGGTSTIYVGELSGTANSTVEGGMVNSDIRHLAYEVGASNTDATFNGVIKNFETVTLAQLKIYKKGNGTWTLNGTSTYSPGLFNVDAGTANMNGSLTGSATTVTVATGATLNVAGSIAGATTINGTASVTTGASINGATIVGTGATILLYGAINNTASINGVAIVGSTGSITGAVTVGVGGSLLLNGTAGSTAIINGTLLGSGTVTGATTINGTLEGKMNFGSTLGLAGTTKFVVNGINEGEFDKINVVGEANVGGAVEITVNIAAGVKGVDKIRNANPPVGTRIKLINAGSIVTTLPPVHYPSTGWTFLPASGELVYDPANIISGLVNNGIEFRIYPTLTRDNLNVEGNVSAIEVINLAGQIVKQVQANGTKTVVSMNNLSAGAYFVKALMEDGSVNVQNVILQK